MNLSSVPDTMRQPDNNTADNTNNDITIDPSNSLIVSIDTLFPNTNNTNFSDISNGIEIIASYWDKPDVGEPNQIIFVSRDSSTGNSVNINPTDYTWKSNNSNNINEYFELRIDNEIVEIIDIGHNTLPNDGYRLIIREDQRPDENSTFSWGYRPPWLKPL